jgi:protein-S-isoprenylcysteine O-methyltransferase Ste14
MLDSLNFTTLKRELKIFKIALAFFTCIELTFFCAIFYDPSLGFSLTREYHIHWILVVLTLIFTGIALHYIWKKIPNPKSKKTNATFLVLFLGIIGLWLWLPNKREFKQIETAYNKKRQSL